MAPTVVGILVALLAVLGTLCAVDGAGGMQFDTQAGTCSLPVPLNHSDAGSPTFILRCWVNAEHWKLQPGAPIYVIPGGEAPVSDFSATSLYPAHSARRRHALVVSMEHRMFGESMPVRRLSDDVLPFLTVEQAVLDLVHLIADTREYFNATAANPVVIWGCSYAGLLASVVRESTEGVVAVAVAGNAPLQATDDFRSYGTVLHASLANVSAACAANTAAVVANVSASVLSSSADRRKWVTDTFGACGPIGAARDDALTFLNMYGWLGPLYPVLQSGPYEGRVSAFCDSVAKNGAVVTLVEYTRRQGMDCAPSSFDNWVEMWGSASQRGPAPTDTGRAFQWLLCTSLGYSITGTGGSGSAPSVAPPPIDSHWYNKFCSATFGHISPMPLHAAVKTYNALFGGQRPNNTKTIFVVGDVDPWSSLAPSAWEVPTGSSRVEYPGGHCTWWPLPKEGDSPSIIAARDSIEVALDGYLSHDGDGL